MRLGPALAHSQALPTFRELDTPASSSRYVIPGLAATELPVGIRSTLSALVHVKQWRNRKVSRWTPSSRIVQVRTSSPVCLQLVTSIAKLSSYASCCQEEKQGGFLQVPEQGSRLR